MILPFLFVSEKDPLNSLWLFYKYMEFALQNKTPILAEEIFFKKPSYYEKRNEYPFRSIENGIHTIYGFPKPTDEKMAQLQKYAITKDEKKALLTSYKTEEEAYQTLILKEDRQFEKLITRKFDQIEKESGQKIEAVLSWRWYKSLEKVCKKRGIQLIQMELTTFRPPVYQTKLGYFQFYDKFNATKVDEDYHTFLETVKKPIYFNRKELLAFFLDKDFLPWLNRLNYQPKYEFGISVGPIDPIVEAECKTHSEIAVKEIKKIASCEEVSLRLHPSRNDFEKFKKEYDVHQGGSSLEWILKNRRIVSVGSNLAFEAMLLGRTSYVLGENFPYREGAITNLDTIDEKVCEISYLNYIIFAYYTPYELMFDAKYIAFRLTQPSLVDIYHYHQKYLFDKYQLSRALLKQTSKERFKEILVKVHHLSEEECLYYLHPERIDYQEETKRLRKLLEREQRKYQDVITSKSWKVTRPLRWFLRKVKGTSQEE